MLNSMSVQLLVPIGEYLKTSYSPDREYRAAFCWSEPREANRTLGSSHSRLII